MIRFWCNMIDTIRHRIFLVTINLSELDFYQKQKYIREHYLYSGTTPLGHLSSRDGSIQRTQNSQNLIPDKHSHNH